jgi:hypothetical protein
MPRPPGGDAFRSRWLGHMVLARSGGTRRKRDEVTAEIRCGDDATTVFTTAGETRMARGPTVRPDGDTGKTPGTVSGKITG